MTKLLSFLWKYKSQLIVLLTPILLLPLPLISRGQQTLCGYTVILMGVYWLFEAVPLPITAFIPTILLPAFGIMTTREVCETYLTSTNTVIMGGCMVALAIENTHLHRRVAVNVLLLVGSKPRWLLLGFQLTTWILSMCITNTATTAMMLPILHAVVSQMSSSQKGFTDDSPSHQRGQRGVPSSDMAEVNTVVAEFNELDNASSARPISMLTIKSDSSELVTHSMSDLSRSDAVSSNGKVTIDAKQEEKETRALFLALTMSVVYASNIGGIATLTGTGPNLILKKNVDDWWKKRGLGEAPVNFSTWMVYGLPISLVNIIFLWIWLQILYLGFRTLFGCCYKASNPEREARIKRIIELEKEKLGPIRYSESMVAFLFILLVCLWFFRAPGFAQGWSALFKAGYIGTATPAMLIVFLLFILPMDIPGHKHGKTVETILNWPMIQRKFPWGVIFLMGGGFAIAEASIRTGLSVWIGRQLQIFTQLPGFVMIYVLCFAIGVLTEVTSNVAICTMLMPIVGVMAENMGRSPLYLMMPIAVSSSFAFMLPVANPPNALGFEFAQMSITDMAKAGSVMKIISIIPVTIITQTLAYSFFNYDQAPWQAANATSPPI